MNDCHTDWSKDMKVCVNWQQKMQMVAFLLVPVICLVSLVRTRPEWAGSRPSACSALITVGRSFIWRTFIYSFNFLSFMCSGRSQHSCDTSVCCLECAAAFFFFLIGRCLLSFHHMFWLSGKLYFSIYFGNKGQKKAGAYPQRRRILLFTFSQFSVCCSKIKTL